MLLTVLKISTHTPLARRDKLPIEWLAEMKISTHTPLARRDEITKLERGEVCNFYSHASREA